MSVNFMGLVGPTGVLPLDYTTLVAQRVQARDTAFRDFLDIFQHRLISLFYRAWLKHRFLVQRERGQEDTVTVHLLDLAGLGVGAQRDLPGVNGTALAGYAGLVAAQPRSAQALKQVLEDYFQVSVDIVQFIGGWYPLRQQDQCEVGDDQRVSSQLGMGALAGDEVWDPQAGVRVRIGPLDQVTYRSFLPDGSAHQALRTLLRYFSHGEHEFQVQLVLAEDEVPGLQLGEGEHHQLGWDTWLRTRPPARPADQTILRVD
jgi:type VI secretion system protein ImpH